ncbi:OmpA family protein [Costertonia aggregata]|uniref:OmpA family protein n=1 Tax=Costertonia aggregata TaxID=343403 RepID=A0A7H9ATE6_9FLAO|nr:OmpA family protein [Costertonia aggregata]QLG46677.1 OmpA family protein [Costertonia aggregata]
MKIFKLCLFVLVCGFVNIVACQEINIAPKDSIVQSSWMFGVGYNIVDDSATPFGWDFIRIKDTWNAVPYPSRLSIGKFWKNGIGVTVIGTYNKYEEGKLVDGQINATERDYFALDFMGSYDLNKIVGHTGWFDPYVHMGAGYSSIGGAARTTLNAGYGFRIWLNEKWGIDLNTIGKWGLGEAEKSTKQLQHAAAIVYQFDINKGLTKRGIKKLELLEAIEKKEKIYQDSLATELEYLEKAKLLAKRLEHEKEMARLAQLQKDKDDIEKTRKSDIENTIKQIGSVYFDLNSSYLNPESKNKLNSLAQLFKNSPKLKIQMTSHTDSRGGGAYNMWLSERRLKRTMDYLASKGVETSKIDGKSFGEQHIMNECKNGVKCPESKHRVNRRVEFIIMDL